MSFKAARVLPVLVIILSLEPVTALVTETALTMFGRKRWCKLIYQLGKDDFSVIKYKLWESQMCFRMGGPQAYISLHKRITSAMDLLIDLSKKR